MLLTLFSLPISIREMRKCRSSHPIYYFLQAIDLQNQKDTISRKNSRFMLLLSAFKQRELDLALSQSVDSDRFIFVDSFIN